MFWTRLFSGIVLLVIAIGAMWIGGGMLAGVLLLISLIAYKELTMALKVNTPDKKWNMLEIIGMLSVAVYYGGMVFIGGEKALLLGIVFAFMALMFCYVLAFPRYTAQQTLAAFFAFMYAPVMLSFVYMTREYVGIYVVWLILISSWGSDTCAYAVGMLIGKHKIFPVLSPKKSLEGCIGGVLGSALIGGIYGYVLLQLGIYSSESILWVLPFICAVGAVMSMMGDLAASAIKRQNNIKDYGKLIPGHGGIMDRFDSTIVTAPMIYFLCLLFLQG